MKKLSNVAIRKKLLKNGKISLFLDFYPPVYNIALGKETRREFLSLYLFNKPTTTDEKNANKETFALAEKICIERQSEINKGVYGLTQSKQGNFFTLITEIANESKTSKKNVTNAIGKTLEKFVGAPILPYKNVNDEFANNFKKFLEKNPNYKGNTARNYLNAFKSILNIAYLRKIIPTKVEVKNLPMMQTQREYLTLNELELLGKTNCDKPNIKRAFLFACLTGLRFSDLVKLRWANIKNNDGKTCIAYTQQKTSKTELLPISDNALKYLGEPASPNDLIFNGITKRNDGNLEIRIWALRAGIDKKLTFHSARHTYATLQLTLGTDIYTVSKLLGHSNISTTQVYGKIIDEKRRDAVDKLNDINI